VCPVEGFAVGFSWSRLWKGLRGERGNIKIKGRTRWVYVSCVYRGFTEKFNDFIFGEVVFRFERAAICNALFSIGRMFVSTRADLVEMERKLRVIVIHISLCTKQSLVVHHLNLVAVIQTGTSPSCGGENRKY